MPLLTSVSDSSSFGKGGAPVFAWVTPTAIRVVETTTSNITFAASNPLGGTNTYALDSGSLPAGVTLNSDGSLTGTFPNETSDTLYVFTLLVTNSLGPTAPKTFDFTVAISTVTFENDTDLGTGIEGNSFTTTVVANSDATATHTYSVVTGSLPSGLSLNGSSGVISGTMPAVSSNTVSTFTIRATNSLGSTADKEFTITTNTTTVTWVTPSGLIGSEQIEISSYSQTVTATTNGTGATVSYSLVSGSLPSGLSLNSSTGAITGTTPDVNGDTDFDFTLRATDSRGSTADRTFRITITDEEAFIFNKTISSTTDNYNLKSDAIANGWNQILPLRATIVINSGVTVRATSISNYAFQTGSTFPSRTILNITNGGVVCGKGGTGGTGAGSGAGGRGGDGGPALRVQYATTITNNGTIGGGGAGGGGGGAGNSCRFGYTAGGGGGGGGAGFGTGGSVVAAGTGVAGTVGGTGTATARGTGGPGGNYVVENGGAGGNGGNLGADGSNGSAGTGSCGGGGGGSSGDAGAAVVGNSFITWAATGTRLGDIS